MLVHENIRSAESNINPNDDFMNGMHESLSQRDDGLTGKKMKNSSAGVGRQFNKARSALLALQVPMVIGAFHWKPTAPFKLEYFDDAFYG